MLKGLAITPPVLGRIAIGKVVERNGKRLPEKDDQFTLTSQVQYDGQWLLHPLDKENMGPLWVDVAGYELTAEDKEILEKASES